METRNYFIKTFFDGIIILFEIIQIFNFFQR